MSSPAGSGAAPRRDDVPRLGEPDGAVPSTTIHTALDARMNVIVRGLLVEVISQK